MRNCHAGFALVTVVLAGARGFVASGSGATRRPRSEGDQDLGLDHGVGGRVAHRGVHEDGRRLPEAATRARRSRSTTRASSALAQQIQGGAPADVFASADGANMQKFVTGGQVTTDPIDFTANSSPSW